MKRHFGIALLTLTVCAFPAFANEADKADESDASEKPPASRMNAYEIQYVAGLSRKIRKNWAKTEVDERRDLTLSFVLDEDGAISQLEVIKSSGSEELDKQGLDAVNKSTPFEKPPSTIETPKKLRLNFVFQKKEQKEASSEVKEDEDDN